MSLLQTILQINSVARNETVRHGKPKINMGWYRTERESTVVTAVHSTALLLPA